MSEHEGPGHGAITLSLSGVSGDGGHWHQSWVLCECGLAGIQARLGPPAFESVAQADSVRRVAEFVLNEPGRIHLMGEEFGSAEPPIAGA